MNAVAEVGLGLNGVTPSTLVGVDEADEGSALALLELDLGVIFVFRNVLIGVTTSSFTVRRELGISCPFSGEVEGKAEAASLGTT